MCIEVIITVTCTHYISLNDVVCTQLHANVDPTTQLTQDDAQKIQSNKLAKTIPSFLLCRSELNSERRQTIYCKMNPCLQAVS